MLLPRWNHDIIVTPVSADMCRYRDIIDVEAGALTPVVVGWARWFYAVRQRRWCRLAEHLDSTG